MGKCHKERVPSLRWVPSLREQWSREHEDVSFCGPAVCMGKTVCRPMVDWSVYADVSLSPLCPQQQCNPGDLRVLRKGMTLYHSESQLSSLPQRQDALHNGTIGRLPTSESTPVTGYLSCVQKPEAVVHAMKVLHIISHSISTTTTTSTT
uniref:Uncharacterized protein n=1 Tax=Hucho hucho TaxID=62062 RepID=A0A4W5JJ90_9TELE